MMKTSNNKKKIILISDESWLGGASLVNKSIIEEGEKKGYNLSMYVYGKKEAENQKKFSVPKADFYILANYGYIPKKDLVDFITNNKNKFVRFFHDIPGFISQIPSSFFSESEALLELMINNSAHTFMISPMQHGVISNRINVNDEKVTIIPPFIPITDFYDKKEVRVNGSWLYVGDVSPARGIEKSLRVAINSGGKKFVIGGPEVTPGYLNFLKQNYGNNIEIEYLGVIDYSDMNDVMNKYENFIYTPEIYDSFCRKLVEAKAAGMKLFVDNKRIGLFSYPENYDIKNAVLSSNKVIWEKINNFLI